MKTAAEIDRAISEAHDRYFEAPIPVKPKMLAYVDQWIKRHPERFAELDDNIKQMVANPNSRRAQITCLTVIGLAPLTMYEEDYIDAFFGDPPDEGLRAQRSEA
jgi:hypothetical protein